MTVVLNSLSRHELDTTLLHREASEREALVASLFCANRLHRPHFGVNI